jgi:hypothetical protein
MAKKYGKAGQGARDMALGREIKVLGIAGVMLLVLWLWFQNMASMTKLGLPAVIILVVLFKIVFSNLEKKGKHLKKRARDAERGARAEEKIEEKLSALLDGYVSFHDLSFPGFNIDHVVVGPSGVFLVETKSHSGKVTSNGDTLLLNGHAPEKDIIKQTWSQTFHLKNLLKERLGKEIPVKPVLCFSRAFVQVRGAVKGITVVNGGFLNTFITKEKSSLTAEQIAQITACLKMTTKAEEPEKKLCPHCSTELVLRQFQSGDRAGQYFYGCLPCRKGWPVAEI